MRIFPAIDLIEGKAVRLLKGDYDKKTVYHDDPVAVARAFGQAGAGYLHLVDLDGAKRGTTDNFETVKRIVGEGGLFTEIGGGIRSLSVCERYFEVGVDRVILGTAAVTDRAFLEAALLRYGERIAVGVDVKDGLVAIKGWLETTSLSLLDVCEQMQTLGVSTLIVTDISKDGAMKGTNLSMYETLSSRFSMNITASGGVSSLEDVRALRALDLYGAIIGKAYYTGAIDLREAIEVAT